MRRTDGSDVEQAYSEQSAFLVVYVTIATPDWVARCVEGGLLLAQTRDGSGRPYSDDFWEGVMRRAAEEGFAASRYVAHHLRMLVSCVIAVPSTTPLRVVRDAVTYATLVLLEAGISPARQCLLTTTAAQVDDPYGISPATLASLHPLLPEVARNWDLARTAVLREREHHNT
ncbi:MAG TPA: hypothetical protein VGG17_10490 [Acidimicrobiales bacterium]|jgi:hypothetical protein